MLHNKLGKKRGMKGKKELIVMLLNKHSEGLTVIEIARLLKISRNTAAVYLAELKGEDKIWIRKIGMAKLNYWKGGKKR